MAPNPVPSHSDVEYERRLALLRVMEAAHALVQHAANQAALIDGALEARCDDLAVAIEAVVRDAR